MSDENKNMPRQAPNAEDGSSAAKPAWHRPIVTHIDMKYTMTGSGGGGPLAPTTLTVKIM